MGMRLLKRSRAAERPRVVIPPDGDFRACRACEMLFDEVHFWLPVLDCFARRHEYALVDRT
jgi:hypothetical protein